MIEKIFCSLLSSYASPCRTQQWSGNNNTPEPQFVRKCLPTLLFKMKILFVPLLCLSYVLAAQEHLRVIPPAPTTAALGLYGEHPVDMATGIPDIRVPIHTITTPRLKVPVYISYHPILRVKGHASWV